MKSFLFSPDRKPVTADQIDAAESKWARWPLPSHEPALPQRWRAQMIVAAAVGVALAVILAAALALARGGA